ncbi:hypothetical protein [Novosphingobium sp.]|uniref:hypothetical protein n=1 Tax=Novosphingobium sp. TaxID=1874826 RepID=UPI0031DD9546
MATRHQLPPRESQHTDALDEHHHPKRPHNREVEDEMIRAPVESNEPPRPATQPHDLQKEQANKGGQQKQDQRQDQRP